MKELIIVSLVCAVLLFGCAAQGQAKVAGEVAKPSAPAQQPPSTAGPATPPATGGQTGTGTTPEPTKPAAPEKTPSELLIGALSSSSGWKIVYDVDAGSAGSYEMTQYAKGGNTRTDMAFSGMESRTYTVAGKVNSCVLAGASWMCNDVTAQVGGQTDISQQLQADSAKYTITADGTEAVAATTANCYKLVSTDGTVRYCISAEGAPLYVKTSAQGTEVVMKAKSYTTIVTDADFVLPG